MKLLRVQVPDFRVLKNVDISFEKDFVPNIFPLGSQNGGGKSTLLQLIFVLLHCSGDSDKHEFIKNMLYGFEIDDSGKGVIAAIDIWDGEKIVNLEFVAYKYLDDNELLISSEELFNTNNTWIDDNDDFFLLPAQKEIRQNNEKIKKLESEITTFTSILNSLRNIQKIESPHERESQLIILEPNIRELNGFRSLGHIDFKEQTIIDDIKDIIIETIDAYKLKIKEILKQLDYLQCISQEIEKSLHSNRLLYICDYFNSEEKVILCHIDNLELKKAGCFLSKLSKEIFITAPTTQMFLFLTKDTRKSLFKQHNNYQSEIQSTKSKLSGFFPYDFLAVNLLMEVFKSARDKDFKQAIETGEYGNNYQQLVNDLNLILFNKKININPDLSGFTFKLDADGQDIELFPEDLSHGELKRLSIYAWIKYNIIEDSIVLIDEIENGFHPDWQYQIIKDIAEWAPKNQYIIATHSYELCQAVTPAHVKELEPRLIKQESES